MKPSKPPAVASWMLRHLVLVDRTEALEGDLLEEFHRRRSAGWYWRQVWGAIVASIAGELRQHWKLLSLEAVFVWVWTYYSLLFLRFAQERFWILAFEPHGRFLYWVLVRCSGILSLALPFTIYLAVKRFTHFLPALCGLCAGIAVSLVMLTSGFGLPSGAHWSTHWLLVLPAAISIETSGVLPYAITHPWWLLPCNVMRQSLPLLFAIWVAQYRREKSPSSPRLAG
jgi:hypothetical protein